MGFLPVEIVFDITRMGAELPLLMRITAEFNAAVGAEQRYLRLSGKLIPIGVPPFHPAFAVAVFLRSGLCRLDQSFSALLAFAGYINGQRIMLYFRVGEPVTPTKGFNSTFSQTEFFGDIGEV